MAQVVIDGVAYDDGNYIGMCYRCKDPSYFYGIVRMTERGRVLASGQCSNECGTTLTRVLVYS